MAGMTLLEGLLWVGVAAAVIAVTCAGILGYLWRMDEAARKARTQETTDGC